MALDPLGVSVYENQEYMIEKWSSKVNMDPAPWSSWPSLRLKRGNRWRRLLSLAYRISSNSTGGLARILLIWATGISGYYLRADTIQGRALLFSRTWWHCASAKWWSTNTGCGQGVDLYRLFPNTCRSFTTITQTSLLHRWSSQAALLTASPTYMAAIIWMGGCGY